MEGLWLEKELFKFRFRNLGNEFGVSEGFVVSAILEKGGTVYENLSDFFFGKA